MAEPHGQLMRYKKRRRRPSLFLRLRGGRCPGGEQVLRLRAQAGAFRALARVTFFFCKKKVTKENHLDLRSKGPLARGGFRRPGGESVSPWRGGGLRRPHFFLRRKKCGKESRLDLRSKGPLARGGQVRIWRCVLAHEGQWVTLLSVQGSLVPLAPLPLTLCEGRIGCAGGVGDYQIAPIAVQSTAMGRWRLTPPGYGGTCLPAGRSAGLTRHRCVIQHRGPIKGEGLGVRQ